MYRIRHVRPRARIARAVVAALTAVAAATTVAVAASTPAAESQISNLYAYVHAQRGHPNPNLKPIDIGYVSNQGGSVVGYPESTTATQMAVKWINQHTTGVHGHALKLVTCFVPNSEEEGLPCAEKFLADKNMPVIMYGTVFVGGATIDATINGQKPIVEPFAQNAVDVKAKDNFQLFTGPPFDFFGWGTAAKYIEHTKSGATGAVLYDTGTGANVYAGFVAQALKAVGVKTKLVGFPVGTTDLTGALEAAGAPTADIVAPMLASGPDCVAMEKAMTALNVDPAKVVGLFNCAEATVKNAYPTHDYPQWWYGEAQSGDALVNTPTGRTYRSLLAEYGDSKYLTDPLFPGMIGTIFTITQLMNNISYAQLTPQALIKQIRGFKGPQFMGEPTVRCGNYASGPGNCGGGDHFFRYEGNGAWKRFSYWLNIPLVLQKQYHAKVLVPEEQAA